MSRAGAADGGFTLLELLVVLVIMAVLATALAGRVVGGYGAAGVRADADRLVEDLRRTRELARAIDRTVDLELAADGSGWAEVVLAEGTTARLLGRTPEAPQRVRFHPDGSAEPAAVLIARDGSGFRVSVEPLTGAVDLERADAPG
jgi:type II secretion system protein H